MKYYVEELTWNSGTVPGRTHVIRSSKKYNPGMENIVCRAISKFKDTNKFSKYTANIVEKDYS